MAIERAVPRQARAAVRRWLAPAALAAALALVALAAVDAPPAAAAALGQMWPPFALVVGLGLIGVAAARQGVFAAAGARVARLPIGPAALLVTLLGLVAAVTVVLNLDTAVIFLTPVLVQAARARGVDEAPFLYGTVLMANAASLLLPGANLTNLIVAGQEASGLRFARAQAAPWAAAVGVTALVVLLAHRRALAAAPAPPPAGDAASPWRPALVPVALAVALVLGVPWAAAPVLALGVLAVLALRVPLATVRRSLDLGTIATLLAFAVAAGTVARASGWVARLAAEGPAWASAAGGALAAVALNNLPAAALLSATPPAHPTALLIGLDVGPNLAVTGSLSAVLWFAAARSVGARPSALRFSRLGLVAAPAAMAAALLAMLV